MIASITCWIIILTTCYMWGELSISLYNKLTHRTESYSFIESFTVGMCIVGTIIGITSLALPSSIGVLTGLIVVPFAYYLFDRKSGIAVVNRIISSYRALSIWQIVFSVAILLSFLLFVATPPQFPDTFVYHIQNMMWNEEYSVVPGIANLQHRFAFNSNLLLLSSVFGLRPLFGQFIFGVNALYMAMLLIYIICNVARRQHLLVTVLSLITFVALFIQYIIHIASPATDLLPNLLIVFLMLVIFTDRDSIKNKSLLFWLIPVFCLTLKLSMALICIFCLYLLIRFLKAKDYRSLSVLSVLSLLVVLPWLARNIIISGYLIFPYPAIDWFNVDWKVPIETAITEKAYIKAYAISIEALHNTQGVLDWPFSVKLQKWLSGISHLDLAILCTTLLSPLLMLIANWNDRRKKIQGNAEVYLTWAIAFAGFVFCFYMAPSFRFSFGLLTIASCIPVYLLVNSIKLNSITILSNFAVMLFVLIIGGLSVRYFRSVLDTTAPLINILYVPQSVNTTEFKAVQRIEQKVIDGTTFYITEGSCIDCDLPCMEGKKDIEMRGNSLQEGFRTKK